MLETSNLLDYTPEQLGLMIECIEDKIKVIRFEIERRESIILKADDMSERYERFMRGEIETFWSKLEQLHEIRAAVRTNHQHATKREKLLNQ